MAGGDLFFDCVLPYLFVELPGLQSQAFQLRTCDFTGWWTQCVSKHKGGDIRNTCMQLYILSDLKMLCLPVDRVLFA